MEAHLVNALTLFFQQGAIQLREPRFRKLPFRIRYEILDTLPVLREQIFDLLDECINPQDFDAVATSPFGCKYWPAIYADRHGLPFLMPIEVSASAQTPLGLYGEQIAGSKILMLNTLNPSFGFERMDSHPFVRMYDVLSAVHCKTVKIVSLFDADRLQVFSCFFSANRTNDAEVKSIFTMQDVLRTVSQTPVFYGVDPEVADGALKHYETSETWQPKGT
jgi:hypothetical protein